MILDLEGPDGLLQLTFCSEEGGRAALHTEALLLPVFPLLAKLQLLSSGLFPVLKSGGGGGPPSSWAALKSRSLVASFLRLRSAPFRRAGLEGRKLG